MIPDAHCHLDQVDDPGRAVHEAAEAGVGPILAVSMDAASAEVILRLHERYPGQVFAGIGLHPSRVPELSSADVERELNRLEQLVSAADFVGEIGLDYKDAVEERDRVRQREALERQFSWAAAHRLPVNLHSRRADRDVLEAAIAFRGQTGLGCLMHWFTHSKKLARLCAEKGIFISPGPSILEDQRSAEVAASIAPSLLLIETDSPVVYGAAGSARPAWARRVLDRMAELLEIDSHSLEKTVTRNLEGYMGRNLLG